MATIKLPIAAVLAVCLAAIPAHGASFASYRAVFELGLGKTAESIGVAALTGRLVLEWRDTCEGSGLVKRRVGLGRLSLP